MLYKCEEMQNCEDIRSLVLAWDPIELIRAEPVALRILEIHKPAVGTLCGFGKHCCSAQGMDFLCCLEGVSVVSSS